MTTLPLHLMQELSRDYLDYLDKWDIPYYDEHEYDEDDDDETIEP